MSNLLEVYNDNYFMKLALNEAQKAKEQGEVPVGAVVVSNNRVIAKAHNQTQMLNDVTAHAEIIAITAAAAHLGAKYLIDCSLFVTLEPCVMCAGALRWSQISRIVYGADDSKHGFMKYGKELLHPRTKLEFGIMHEECSAILKTFFSARRLEKS